LAGIEAGRPRTNADLDGSFDDDFFAFFAAMTLDSFDVSWRTSCWGAPQVSTRSPNDNRVLDTARDSRFALRMGAPPGRFERPTNGLGSRCSIHLSYGGIERSPYTTLSYQVQPTARRCKCHVLSVLH
jgi:hypothetical protein